jgi:pimeloyl-ACP methyl ester carboxylesterase
VLRSFDEGRLFGAVTGSAPPRILALHGWARTHRDFDGVLRAAPRPLDTVALDLPGFGSSPPPPTAWGSHDYAAAVLPVLEEMAPDVVVLGHSMGGRVALQLAALAPERVRALVLTGVPLPLQGDARVAAPRGFRLIRRLRRLGLLSEDRLEAARQRHGSADYRAASGVMRDTLVRVVAERYDEVLSAVGCPVTMVWGDDDTAAPLAMAHAAEARLGAARLVVCPGAGHLTPLSVPEVLAQAVWDALEREP